MSNDLVARQISREELPDGDYLLQIFKIASKTFENEPDDPKFEWTFVVADGPMKGAAADCLTSQTWSNTTGNIAKILQILQAVFDGPVPKEVALSGVVGKYLVGTYGPTYFGGKPTGRRGWVAFAPARTYRGAAPTNEPPAPPQPQGYPPAPQPPQPQGFPPQPAQYAPAPHQGYPPVPPQGYAPVPQPPQPQGFPPQGYPAPQPPQGYPPQQAQPGAEAIPL